MNFLFIIHDQDTINSIINVIFYVTFYVKVVVFWSQIMKSKAIG